MKYILLKATGLGVVSAFTQTSELTNSLSLHTLKPTIATALHAEASNNRRAFLSAIAVSATFISSSTAALADDQGAFSVDDFLKSGQVAMPMGVSGQAGKSKPETGIIFRDGTDVSRNTKSGNVLAEIVMNPQSKDPIAILTSFTSPWPLAKGSVFDIECRDASTGDGAFLSLSGKTKGVPIADLPNSFFLDKIFASNGRFSFYGAPTDIKVKKSYLSENGKNRIIELGFSLLSQSTGAEIPRTAMMVATVPEGTEEAVLLVASSTAVRWKNKGADEAIRKTIGSFSAEPSPITGMKVRSRSDDEPTLTFRNL